MSALILILLLVALGAFTAATLGATLARVNLVALGLACWALVLVIDRWPE